jgi:hypothetical protein
MQQDDVFTQAGVIGAGSAPEEPAVSEAVAVQAEVLAELRARTGQPVWPYDTLADLGVDDPAAGPETSVGELIAARVAAA